MSEDTWDCLVMATILCALFNSWAAIPVGFAVLYLIGAFE